MLKIIKLFLIFFIFFTTQQLFSKKKDSLHQAIIKEDFELVKKLLAQGANINKQNRYGNTPLHLAAFYGITPIVHYLLAHGANIYIQNKNGEIPVYLAKKQSIIMLLLEKEWSDNMTAYLNKKSTKNISLNQIIKRNNGMLKKISFSLSLALALCVFRTTSAALDERPPLHTAVEQNNAEEIIRLITQEHHDVNQKDQLLLETPLHRAAKNLYLEIADVLLMHKANVKALSRFKNTPLHEAVIISTSDTNKKKQQTMVLLLLFNQAPINAQNEFGFTALHYAAKNKDFAMMQLLIERGADQTIKNDDGLTPDDLLNPNIQTTELNEQEKTCMNGIM